MKLFREILLTVLFVTAFLTLSGNAQTSRANTIKRPCPASSTPASVSISRTGAITVTPCSGQTVTQTTTGTVTFAAPSLVLGNDADANVDINSAFSNMVRLGTTSSLSGGQILVGSAFTNSFTVPATLSLQLGASAVGSAARLDLNRVSQTASLSTNVFSWADSSVGVTDWRLRRTITAGGTTGNQTINLMSGTVNFAAATSSLVVTNSTVTTSSLIFLTKRTNDATCDIDSVVAAAGSFTITMTANCTAETSVGFLVTN